MASLKVIFSVFEIYMQLVTSHYFGVSLCVTLTLACMYGCMDGSQESPCMNMSVCIYNVCIYTVNTQETAGIVMSTFTLSILPTHTYT